MKVSKKLILNEAIEIKKFVEKNKKLPKYATIENSQFTPSQYCYLMSKLISKMSLPTIGKITVKEPTQSWGDNFKDVKISSIDYIDIAKRVTSYIETHKQAPNYASYKGKNIKFELYTYCFAKILSFYKENNRLPSTCNFNSADLQADKTTATTAKKTTATSTSSSKKTTTSAKTTTVAKDNCTNPYTNYPKDTVQGSGRMGQKTSYFCLPHSFRSCMYKFGLKLDETQIAKVMGTTKKGTGHEGVKYAINWVNKNYKGNYTYEWKYLSDLGKTTTEQFTALAKLMCKKDTDIIVHSQYRMKYGHYETIYKIDTAKKIVYVLNSLGKKSGTGYLGYVEQRSFDTFKDYINAKKGTESICIIRRV